MKNILILLFLAFTTLTVWGANENKENKNSKESTEAVVLMGTVVDESTGEALPGVRIKIDGLSHDVYTDLDGNFAVRDMKAGTYDLEISLVSYKENTITDLILGSGAKNALKVELKR
jgi:hypothetical protein